MQLLQINYAMAELTQTAECSDNVVILRKHHNEGNAHSCHAQGYSKEDTV
jgi:hypothetical protein